MTAQLMQAVCLQRVNQTKCHAEDENTSWSLVRGPEQENVDEYGTGIPIDPFETGYANATADQLRCDLARRVPHPRAMLESETFAVLDYAQCAR